MFDTTIALSGVSKQYRLRRGWYVTSLKDEMGRLTARLLGHDVEPREDFWALRDVSFSLKRGEVMGLIGMNGAGKSTLLKILSKVTVPTTGSFVTNGRLGSLIEIGAGFHQDLTGRENVFLNGSIMGMPRREVQRKLGFAVAAHTDPDILLIDEILAVGDASFQAKCLNKLAELKEQDKTIILVSHSLSNITEHSTKVLWIDHGTVRMLGDPDAVVDAYLEHVSVDLKAEDSQHEARDSGGDRPISILDVTLADADEQPESRFDREGTAVIDVTYTASRPVPGAIFGVSILDLHGYYLGGIVTDPDSVKITAPVEQAVLRLTLSPLLFNKGAYTLDVYALDPKTKRHYDLRRRALRLVVDGHRSDSRESTGYIFYPHRWEQLK